MAYIRMEPCIWVLHLQKNGVRIYINLAIYRHHDNSYKRLDMIRNLKGKKKVSSVASTWRR